MRRSIPIVMSSLAAAGLVLVLTGPAFAKGPTKGPKPVRVTCTTLSGNAASVTSPPKISGCNEPAVTGGSGTFPAGGLGTSGNATVTWAGGLGTTTFSYSETTPAKSHCPVDPTSTTHSNEIEAILHGVVRSNTESNPSTDGGVKAAVTAKVCVTSTLDLSLLPPKPFKL